jgi:predicted unusual protein kinase regulating ubiquinone biosynthesis (AarF/ABC1/UbiB family)
MHPGNILVRVVQPKNSNNTLIKSRPHVVFLDVGMTAELSSNDRVNLLEFFKAVARRDGRAAAESTLKLSKQQNCPNPRAFIEVIYRYPTTSLFVGDRSLDFIGEDSFSFFMIKQCNRWPVAFTFNFTKCICTI